jgi:type IV secretion system protein VirB9
LRLALFLLALQMPVAAMAEVRPAPGPGDPRIQSVVYDTNQVVQLQVATGFQLTVEFALDERIENVAVGDSGAWQVTPNKRGDHLFIKAVQSGVTTNLTVVTDARSYMFELMPLYGPLPDMAYTVRFTYPAPAVATVAATTPAAEPGRYKLGGAKAIRPTEIDDDGEKTYIVWPPETPLPAIFAIDEKGREMLVDGAMRDGQYVIDSVKAKLLFRLDKDVASAVRVKAKR